LNKPNKPNN